MAKLAPLSLIIVLSHALFVASSVSAHWNILNAGFGNGLCDSLKKYCESWRVNVEIHNIRGFEVVPQECVQYVEKYMTSSQYKADSRKALEEVKLYLGGCCCNVKDDGKDAWIFDVDDTLLSTIPYYKKNGFGGQKRDISSLESWMKKCEAPALKPTLELFNVIKDRGLKIFLISSRRESLRSSTVYNLLDVGYNGWAGLSLRSPKDEGVDVTTFKAAARQQLVNEGYRIWGIIGDQWSSFGGKPSANRTFKLPNSIYYI